MLEIPPLPGRRSSAGSATSRKLILTMKILDFCAVYMWIYPLFYGNVHTTKRKGGHRNDKVEEGNHQKIDEIEAFIAADEELGCGFAPAGFYAPLEKEAYRL